MLLKTSSETNNTESLPFDAIIVMGVCGCGKSTIGKALASEYSIPFEDADDYHPASNVEKMKKGIPLDDNDRKPWCKALRDRISEAKTKKAPIVLACSSLKQIYRKQMRSKGCRHQFIYLKGDYETLKSRLSSRKDHFMPISLLDSQFEILEVPIDALTVDIRQTTSEIVEEVKTAISNGN